MCTCIKLNLGYKSTPIFLEVAVRKTSVEEDKTWGSDYKLSQKMGETGSFATLDSYLLEQPTLFELVETIQSTTCPS